MPATYRLRMRASYGKIATALAFALALAPLDACDNYRPSLPANVTVAERASANWPTPRPLRADATPVILAARFNSLDVPLGGTWNGEVVTSSNVQSVALHTTLYEIAMTSVKRGDFRFNVDVYDLPTFLVRPYDLHIVARTEDGREDEIEVPFRIGGRPPISNNARQK